MSCSPVCEVHSDFRQVLIERFQPHLILVFQGLVQLVVPVRLPGSHVLCCKALQTVEPWLAHHRHHTTAVDLQKDTEVSLLNLSCFNSLAVETSTHRFPISNSHRQLASNFVCSIRRCLDSAEFSLQRAFLIS